MNQPVLTSILPGEYKILKPLNARTAPMKSAKNIQQYFPGTIITLDGYSIVQDGYVWGRLFINNEYQYLAVRSTNGVEYTKYIN